MEINPDNSVMDELRKRAEADKSDKTSKVPALLQIDYSALQYRIEQTRGVLRFMHKQQARNKAAAVVRGVECEEMCKTVGQYPAGCQCPGWNGSPASSSD